MEFVVNSRHCPICFTFDLFNHTWWNLVESAYPGHKAGYLYLEPRQSDSITSYALKHSVILLR